MITLERLRTAYRRSFAPTASALPAPVAVPDWTRKLTPAQKAVRAGGEMLTERLPGWHKVISLPDLDVSTSENCIAGQLARKHQLGRTLAEPFRVYGGSYGALMNGLGLSGGTQYGFVSTNAAPSYELNEAWRDYIVALRCA